VQRVRLPLLVASVVLAVLMAVPLSPPAAAQDTPSDQAAVFDQWEAAARRQAPVFGPGGGELAHAADSVGSTFAGVSLRNFYLVARFTNPYDPAEASFDYGVAFRNTGPGLDYRVIVRFGGEWDFGYGPTEPAVTGAVPGFAPAAGTTTEIGLAVVDDVAYLQLNGEFVDTLDVAAHQDAGDVWIGTGFYAGYAVAGESTAYTDFTIWPLDDADVGVDQPEATATIFAARKDAARRQPAAYGPTSGELVQAADSVGSSFAGVALRNVYARALFTNPHDAADGPFDYGLAFRNAGPGLEYRLIVRGDGEWDLTYGTAAPVATGGVPGFDPAAGATTEVVIVAVDDVVYIELNGVLVDAMDVAEHQDIGDVWIGTGFYSGYGVDGEATAYADFTIWSLDDLAAGGGGTDATAVPGPSPSGTTGVTGTSYASPSYGYTFAWDAGWSVAQEGAGDGNDLLVLANGTSTVWFSSYPFLGTAESCVGAALAGLTTIPDFSGFTLSRGADGEPLRGEVDETSGAFFAVYDYQAATDAEQNAYSLYLECRPLPETDAVLLVTQIVAGVFYNDELPVRLALLATVQT